MEGANKRNMNPHHQSQNTGRRCPDVHVVEAFRSFSPCLYESYITKRVQIHIEALITTYTILGVPYYNYNIMPPKTNPILIIKAPILGPKNHDGDGLRDLIPYW